MHTAQRNLACINRAPLQALPRQLQAALQQLPHRVLLRATPSTACLMSNVYYCETVSEQRAARCIAAPGGPDQRRWEAHPGTPPPVPRVEKHETPERD